MAALALLVAGCAGDSTTSTAVKDAVKDVLAGKTGTVTALKNLRGTGPFREYAVPPDDMVRVVGEAMGKKVVAVFENPRAREVVGKERKASQSHDDWYAPDWLSAVIVFVHPVDGDDGRSRIEIHSTNRGKAWRGTIAWEAELPALIDEAVARRGEGRIRPL